VELYSRELDQKVQERLIFTPSDETAIITRSLHSLRSASRESKAVPIFADCSRSSKFPTVARSVSYSYAHRRAVGAARPLQYCTVLECRYYYYYYYFYFRILLDRRRHSDHEQPWLGRPAGRPSAGKRATMQERNPLYSL